MSYSSEVLADTPVGYWRLGEQSGTTASDSSGNARNGTYTGGFTLQAGGLIAEDANDSTSLNGTTGLVSLGTNIFPPVFSGKSQLTMEAWIRVNALPGATAAVCHVPIHLAVAGFRITITSAGTIVVRGRSVSTDAEQIATVTPAVTLLNNIAHIVGVLDIPNDRIRVYYQGSLVLNATVAFANANWTVGTTPTIPDTIGNNNSIEFFNGIIDEVAFYDFELSATRILAHWNEGTVRVTKSMVERQILDVFAATANPITSISKNLSDRRLLPVWAQFDNDLGRLAQIAVNGQISGTVKVNGVAVADRFVRLYYRKHGSLIGSIKTDSTGTFTFLNLDPADRYTVIAFDDTNTSPDYNAKIFDIITPV